MCLGCRITESLNGAEGSDRQPRIGPAITGRGLRFVGGGVSDIIAQGRRQPLVRSTGFTATAYAKILDEEATCLLSYAPWEREQSKRADR